MNPNEQQSTLLPLSLQGRISDKVNNILQVAVKCNLGVFYFQDRIPISVFFQDDGKLDKEVFLSTWKQIDESNEHTITIDNIFSTDAEQIKQRLANHNVFFIARHKLDTQVI